MVVPHCLPDCLSCKERLSRELPLQSPSVKLLYSKPKLLRPLSSMTGLIYTIKNASQAGRLKISLKTPFVKVNRN